MGIYFNRLLYKTFFCVLLCLTTAACPESESKTGGNPNDDDGYMPSYPCEYNDLPKAGPFEQRDMAPLSFTTAPGAGSYGGPIEVVLEANDEDAVIYYTLNGSDPTTESEQFHATVPVYVDEDTQIRAFAQSICQTTNIRSFYFEIDTTLPTIDVISAPAATVSTDPVDDEVFSVRWQADYDGTYRFELGGNGTVGSGALLFQGPIEADIEEKISYISGTEFGIGSNTLYLYVTNYLLNTGYVTFNIVGE